MEIDIIMSGLIMEISNNMTRFLSISLIRFAKLGKFLVLNIFSFTIFKEVEQLRVVEK